MGSASSSVVTAPRLGRRPRFALDENLKKRFKMDEAIACKWYDTRYISITYHMTWVRFPSRDLFFKVQTRTVFDQPMKSSLESSEDRIKYIYLVDKIKWLQHVMGSVSGGGM